MKPTEAYQLASLLAGPLQCLEDLGIPTEDFWDCAPPARPVRELIEKRSGNTLLQKVLQWADGPVMDTPEALRSPFSLLQTKAANPANALAQWITPLPLSIDLPILYPSQEPPKDIRTQKIALVKGFLKAWQHLCQQRGEDVWKVLLPLLERHFSTYPSGSPGVSVFDQARVAGALMACLDPEADAPNPTLALLVKGDISGIQEFIFRVHPKGASKALKARSAEVLHHGELMVARFRECLQMTDAQVLYIGGGNFYFLVPPDKEPALIAEFHRIRQDLLGKDLRFHLGFTPLTETDLQNIGPAWTRVERSLQAHRLKPMDGIPFAKAFTDHPQAIEADNETFRLKANRYKDARGFRTESGEMTAGTGNAYSQLGARAALHLDYQPQATAIAYNDLRLEAGWGGFRFVANRLPKWEKVQLESYLEWESQQSRSGHDGKASPDSAETMDRNPGDIIDFQALSGFSAQAEASRHLGILKMDVDNLGTLFREGLPPEQRSLTRNAALSRTLKWFFAGYIESLVRQPPFNGLLYIIFSGGDDVFLAGPWHLIFAFAGKLREEFARLVGGAQTVTLSGGMLLLEPSYPVNRFSKMAESALESSKTGVKDQITLFGESLTWHDYRMAAQIKDDLVDLIRSGKVSRKILQTLRRSATGFENGIRKANQPMVRMPRIWRLQYYLRDSALGKDKAEKARHAREVETRITSPYQGLIAHNFSRPGGRDHQPILFAVAARWAEFSIRNSQNSK